MTPIKKAKLSLYFQSIKILKEGDTAESSKEYVLDLVVTVVLYKTILLESYLIN